MNNTRNVQIPCILMEHWNREFITLSVHTRECVVRGLCATHFACQLRPVCARASGNVERVSSYLPMIQFIVLTSYDGSTLAGYLSPLGRTHDERSTTKSGVIMAGHHCSKALVSSPWLACKGVESPSGVLLS